MSGVIGKRREEGVRVTLEVDSRGGKLEHPLSFTIPCLFWREDGVWIGVAKGVEVAACGHGFREARFNLREAIESHFECAIELGKKLKLEEKDGI